MSGAADYKTLIDAETWAYIAETDSYYPPDAVQRSVAEQRQVYDNMCRAFFRGYPAGITAQDKLVGGVPVRVYSGTDAPDCSVVYYHGGGFVVGGLESHDDICAEICSKTGYRVISVDYRLCPEHVHPAAFDDSWAALVDIQRSFGGPIVLAGDSAGGNLAAAVAHHARGRLKGIVGQLLIYPGLGGEMDSGTFVTHANAPHLTRDDVLYYADIRSGGEAPKGDPTFAPLQDHDFSGLPPTVVITAECDPLSGDGEAYCDRLQKAGVPAVWINEAGLVHAYLRARKTVARARDSFDRIVSGIRALGAKEWPYP